MFKLKILMFLTFAGLINISYAQEKEIGIQMVDAMQQMIDNTEAQLKDIESALKIFRGEQKAWVTNLNDIETVGLYYKGLVSPFGTPYLGRPNGDSYIVTVDTLSETTAAMIANAYLGSSYNGSIVSLVVIKASAEVAYDGMLHRDQVAGKPELNRMNTDLDMGGNDILNIDNINSQNVFSEMVNTTDIEITRELIGNSGNFKELNVQTKLTSSSETLLEGVVTINALINQTGDFNLNGSQTIDKNLTVKGETRTNGINNTGSLIQNGYTNLKGDVDIDGISSLNGVQNNGSFSNTGSLTQIGDSEFTGSVSISDLTTVNQFVANGHAQFNNGADVIGVLGVDEIVTKKIMFTPAGTTGLIMETDKNGFYLTPTDEGEQVDNRLGYDGIQKRWFVATKLHVNDDISSGGDIGNLTDDSGIRLEKGNSVASTLRFNSNKFLLEASGAGSVNGTVAWFDDQGNAWIKERLDVKSLYIDNQKAATEDWVSENYYTKNETDDRFYIRNEDILLNKSNGKIIIKTSNLGDENNEQAGLLKIGESETASINMSYIGNGDAYIGMGSTVANNIPENWAMRFNYKTNDVYFAAAKSFASKFAVRDQDNVFTQGNTFQQQIVAQDGVQNFGWYEVEGNGGLRWNDYGGEIYMNDNKYIRMNKSLEVEDDVVVGGDLYVSGEILNENGISIFNDPVMDDFARKSEANIFAEDNVFLKGIEAKTLQSEALIVQTSPSQKILSATNASVKLYSNSLLRLETLNTGGVLYDDWDVTGDLSAENIDARNDITIKGESVKQFLDDCRNQNGICEGNNGSLWTMYDGISNSIRASGEDCPWKPNSEWVYTTHTDDVSPYSWQQDMVTTVGCSKVSYAVENASLKLCELNNVLNCHFVQSGNGTGRATVTVETVFHYADLGDINTATAEIPVDGMYIFSWGASQQYGWDARYTSYQNVGGCRSTFNCNGEINTDVWNGVQRYSGTVVYPSPIERDTSSLKSSAKFDYVSGVDWLHSGGVATSSYFSAPPVGFPSTMKYSVTEVSTNVNGMGRVNQNSLNKDCNGGKAELHINFTPSGTSGVRITTPYLLSAINIYGYCNG
jgi:hypothetical protein